MAQGGRREPRVEEGPNNDRPVRGSVESGLDRAEHRWDLQLITQLTSDVGQLTAKVNRLIEDVKDAESKREAHLQETSSRAAIVDQKLSDVILRAQGIADKQNEKVPIWRRMDPANILLAVVGVVTLILTFTLGSGRFDEIGKRVDQTDKRADALQARSDRLEDRVGSKLDQIARDLEAMKVEGAKRTP